MGEESTNNYQSLAKTIHRRLFFVRDQVMKEGIQLEEIISKSQLANYLTRALLAKKFQFPVAEASIESVSSRRSMVLGTSTLQRFIVFLI